MPGAYRQDIEQLQLDANDFFKCLAREFVRNVGCAHAEVQWFIPIKIKHIFSKYDAYSLALFIYGIINITGLMIVCLVK